MCHCARNDAVSLFIWLIQVPCDRAHEVHDSDWEKYWIKAIAHIRTSTRLSCRGWEIKQIFCRLHEDLYSVSKHRTSSHFDLSSSCGVIWMNVFFCFVWVFFAQHFELSLRRTHQTIRTTANFKFIRRLARWDSNDNDWAIKKN